MLPTAASRRSAPPSLCAARNRILEQRQKGAARLGERKEIRSLTVTPAPPSTVFQLIASRQSICTGGFKL